MAPYSMQTLILFAYLISLVFVYSASSAIHSAGTPLDLSAFFNAKAASTGLNDSFADFDGSGRAYPVEHLPAGPSFVYEGINFALPPFHETSKFDTVRTDSQVISVPNDSESITHFQSFHALATAVWPASGSSGYQQGTLTFTFTDGTHETAGFVVADKVQQIEVTLNNLAPLNASTSSWLTATYNVSLVSDDIETVVPGIVKRLRSNDQVVVPVGVRNRVGVKSGTSAKVQVVLSSAGENQAERDVKLEDANDWDVVAGIPEWTNGDASLRTHEAPEWFNDAKFGIFIHWGIYSVPAWAPTGQQYAEWYNWDFHNPPNSGSPTWTHHLQTYGPDVVYDDFIANWTASAWSPNDWTDLFSNAGAKYFVLVTKHHDGFALTYFSIPEWFNPAWGPYGRVSFPGKPALNAFNGSCCDPFTGYIPVDDFLTDVQQPQMETLFYDYDTEILWCDIGGPSIFPDIGAAWYNYAASQGRQVVMNNRCGANQSDFVTPEYATFGAPLSQKWESSAGMDPFSYGYNSDTPPDAYQNASSVITELVDIVSKGGNFLLE
ncbi:hypothetical protein EW026_g4244 [Hermanssonia centrifuga]|uniref:alpha-L-fucosidase n=1 Tax=Hermanssonia centrifuga TaxID=98765 RepID=A0A4S4KJH9_9APHY|nr:hypothetical protein EW026_g4244 [Hermanssonia centrifuga]